MPPPAHVRITYNGVFGTVESPVEIWSCTLNGTFTLGMLNKTRADLVATANILHGRWFAFALSIRSNAIMTYCRVALVDSSGKVYRDPSGAYLQGDSDIPSPIPGQAPGIEPLQVALAMTLESAVPGPTGRGRFFLPSPGYTLGIEAVLTEAARDAHALRLQAFVDALNDDLDANLPGCRICVASAGSVPKGIPPANNPVIRVGVGRVLDTIRRRRSELEEELEYLPVL